MVLEFWYGTVGGPKCAVLKAWLAYDTWIRALRNSDVSGHLGGEAWVDGGEAVIGADRAQLLIK